MKLPRDISGAELARLLRKLGYQITRQSGTLKRLQAETAAELNAFLPAILDRAFRGEL